VIHQGARGVEEAAIPADDDDQIGAPGQIFPSQAGNAVALSPGGAGFVNENSQRASDASVAQRVVPKFVRPGHQSAVMPRHVVNQGFFKHLPGVAMSQAPELNLNDRARALLKALVEDYIRTGQPVGSRNLARSSGLSVSPATVRNVRPRSAIVCSSTASSACGRWIRSRSNGFGWIWIRRAGRTHSSWRKPFPPCSPAWPTWQGW